jgi:hypothetical protein
MFITFQKKTLLILMVRILTRIKVFLILTPYLSRFILVLSPQEAIFRSDFPAKSRHFSYL